MLHLRTIMAEVAGKGKKGLARSGTALSFGDGCRIPRGRGGFPFSAALAFEGGEGYPLLFGANIRIFKAIVCPILKVQELLRPSRIR